MRPGTNGLGLHGGGNAVRSGAVLLRRRRRHPHRLGRRAVGTRRPPCRPRRLHVRAGQPQGQLPDTCARRCRAGRRGAAEEPATSSSSPKPDPRHGDVARPRQRRTLLYKYSPGNSAWSHESVARRAARGVHTAATPAAATPFGRQPPTGAMIRHLFVYGTLATRPAALAVTSRRSWSTTVTTPRSSGTLYDTGHGYPAARFDRPGSIHGRSTSCGSSVSTRRSSCSTRSKARYSTFRSCCCHNVDRRRSLGATSTTATHRSRRSPPVDWADGAAYMACVASPGTPTLCQTRLRP